MSQFHHVYVKHVWETDTMVEGGFWVQTHVDLMNLNHVYETDTG